MEINLEFNPGKTGKRIVTHLGPFLLLYLLVLLGYLSNRYAIFSVDTIPARYLSLSLIREGNLDLDEYRHRIRETGLIATREQRGRLLSDFPVGASFLNSPYYAL